MSICRLVFVSVALGIAALTALCNDKPGPKKPSVEEDGARLIGEWDFKPGGAENEKLKLEGTFKVTFEKDGSGTILHARKTGSTSSPFEWTITEVRGCRVIVLLQNSSYSAAIQYSFLDDKDKADELIVWTGRWGKEFTFHGEWRKLPSKGK